MSDVLYSNKFFSVELKNRHFVVTEKFDCNGAVVVPLLENGNFLLVEHFRPAIGQISLEFPRGARDPGQDTAQTATRELLEETGYAGEAPEFLGNLHTNNSLIASSIDLFVIRNARQVTDQTDGEVAKTREVSKNELKALVSSGQITDSHSLASFAYLMAQ
jgi:ADP-ribose pyrophosphatase